LQGHHAEQVAAWCAQHAGVLPAGHRLRAQRCQAGNFCRQVVSLDVEVIARRIVDRLNGGEKTGDGAAQAGELLMDSGPGCGAQCRGPEVHCGAGLRGRRVDEDCM